MSSVNTFPSPALLSSAGMGWAGLMSFGRTRQSWAVSSAPAGPDVGARVRGQWVGIQPWDSPP